MARSDDRKVRGRSVTTTTPMTSFGASQLPLVNHIEFVVPPSRGAFLTLRLKGIYELVDTMPVFVAEIKRALFRTRLRLFKSRPRTRLVPDRQPC